MRTLPIAKAFTLLEPGPVVLLTTCDGSRTNIMTLWWTMVVDFTPIFAITTGSWNHSYIALRKTRQCVLAIPTVDLLDTVISIGTCSGSDTDKFESFGLTAVKAKRVKAPLIKQCLANVECRVAEFISRRNLIILEGLTAHIDTTRKERRTVHAVGDGRFVVDGRTLDRRKQMTSKLPAGV